MAAVLDQPGRMGGMHFFNPVHKMKLVEIVRALETSDETIAVMEVVAAKMGKETVLVRESPGFVTSRINAMIGNEAFYMLQEGVAARATSTRRSSSGSTTRWGRSSWSTWSASTRA